MSIDKNEFYRKASSSINSSLDLNKALSRCDTYIKSVVPLFGFFLGVIEEGLGILRFIYASMGKKEMHNEEFPLTPPQKAFIDNEIRILEQQKDQARIKQTMIPSPMEELGEQLFSEAADIHADRHMLQQILSIENRRLAIIAFIGIENREFLQEEVDILTSLHDPFAMAVSNALNFEEVLKLKNILIEENKDLRKELFNISEDNILGSEFGLKQVMESAHNVALLDSPVLILGETGVGKDLLANHIHFTSQRREGPFIKVNCGAIPESLMDSELFGHEKGAFTGAFEQKKGRFERADKGTIFLDEVGELPLSVQVRLLRVLQNREIERVGGSDSISIDIRIIAATNRDLEYDVRMGSFRKDLWYRLNVFPISIPPLRERVIDIPMLLHHFIEKKSREMRKIDIPRVETGSIDLLTSYQWPGNVRELENLVERALILHKEGPLSFQSLLGNLNFSGTPNENYPEAEAPITLNKALKMHIEHALKLSKGKINGPGGAAEILDIKPNTLRKKLIKLGIPFGRKAQY